MTDSVAVSHDIAAPPELVWERIADLPSMGRWSPENTGGSWVKGADGPAVGARFAGTNKNGKRSWKTSVKVTTCEAPRAFEFEVTVGLAKVARWGYSVEPTADGCRVTETWTDQRGKLAKALGKPVSGVADRSSHNRQNMETTLANLANAVEAEVQGGAS